MIKVTIWIQDSFKGIIYLFKKKLMKQNLIIINQYQVQNNTK